MRPKLWTLALIGVLSLTAAGCSGCQLIDKVASNNSAILAETVADEKALLVAEGALVGANSLAEAAVDNGLMVGGSPEAVQIADMLATGKALLVVARKAYLAGDAVKFNTRLAAAQETIGSAMKLIPRKPE